MANKTTNLKSLFLLALIAILPLSYLQVKHYLNFDTFSAIVFLLVIIGIIIAKRKTLEFQPMIKIGKIPLIYVVLKRTGFGLNFMENFAKKHNELIKFLGYCFIGLGFVGMIFISINMLYLLFQLFASPIQASQGVALVLPLTNVPGLGYLSFWHFIITLFITMLVHEFAHGIVAFAHGLDVKASGLGALGVGLPLFPLAFVEPDEKKIEKSSDIIQYSIFAAGPLANMALFVIFFCISLFVMTPIESSITHPIGISISGVVANYSAEKEGMKAGMIITSVNGVETFDSKSFSREIGVLKPDQKLSLGTINGTFNLTAMPSPDDNKRGFMGVSGLTGEVRINQGYETFGGIFFWIKGLIKWLFMLNLMIGLVNLLPLMITDGGRMLKTLLSKLYKDKKDRADRIWLIIGSIFLFTLLASLVVKYGSVLVGLF